LPDVYSKFVKSQEVKTRDEKRLMFSYQLAFQVI
jgi:hypothetical protein